MEEKTIPNALNKISDVIVDALSIFDYSYIISGVMSYLVVAFTLSYTDTYKFEDCGKLFIVISLFLCYVLGLMSWLIGKNLRRILRKICRYFRFQFTCPSNYKMSFSTDFEEVFQDVVEGMGKSNHYKEISQNREVAYTYMWKSLYEDENNTTSVEVADIKRIRRYWVMQALFEGLIGTCIISVLCLFFLLLRSKINICSLNFLFVIFAFVILILLLSKEARACAENQIKEVITSYYKYHKN